MNYKIITLLVSQIISYIVEYLFNNLKAGSLPGVAINQIVFFIEQT